MSAFLDGGQNQLLLVSGAWIGIGLLPVIISNEGIPHALRSILVIPPVMIMAAIGCVHVFSVLKKYVNLPNKSRVLVIAFVLVLGLVGFDGFWSYFYIWGKSPNTSAAFTNDYVTIARELNALPMSQPKYVVVEARGTDVRGIPIPAQTVMFLTDTFLPKNQKTKNMHYVLPNDEENIPNGSYIVHLK